MWTLLLKVLLTIKLLLCVSNAQAQFIGPVAAFSNDVPHGVSQQYVTNSPTNIVGNRRVLLNIKDSSWYIIKTLDFRLDCLDSTQSNTTGAGNFLFVANSGGLRKQNVNTLLLRTDSSIYLTPYDLSTYTGFDSRYVRSADTALMLANIYTQISSKQASLGFTPYNATNPSGYINQATAGGLYYPLSSNPSGYLTSVPAQSFASLTGKPTTLSGYGITDAYPLSGNPSGFLTSAVTSIATTSPITGGTITSTGTIGINNAAADNATKGAASFDSSYFSASNGNITQTVKYGTGTISANAVTINAPRGKITVTTPSISANSTMSITLTNSYVTSTSTVIPTVNGNGSNLTIGLICYMKSQTSGSCVINLLNLSLLSLFSTSLVIDYVVIN